ncbi:signal peptide peptidase SppA [Virgibacillus siamensis]|uniref:signal peptide peptidase SppA n=1 Tax=Virgibacillus siamensis TaxID=480071 RepID=UPI000984E936|nr:signal peptide peptidase SppA [Virgibacillus siamensis]
MNTKRWIALGVAVALFVVSAGFQFVTSLATADFESMFEMPTNQEFAEKVIEPGSGNKIAVLELQGVIQDSSGNSLLNSSAYNHDQFMKMLENAGEDKRVDGIILRVNTPGGGVVESDEIHDLVVEIKKKHAKPIYVSMGNTAASGGYYVSAAADKIVAHPATLTGSIGVIMQSINYAEFAHNHGIKFNTIKSGEFKDIMSPSRKMTKEERKILQTMIDGLYSDFVEVIVNGRDMPEEKVRELGDGRVYTGQQAKNNGLVDALGSLDDTIAMMEKDNNWSNAKVVKYTSGFQFNEFLGGTMQSMFGAKTDLFGLREILRESDGPRAMYLYSK